MPLPLIPLAIGAASALPALYRSFTQNRAAGRVRLQDTTTPEERESLGIARQAAASGDVPGMLRTSDTPAANIERLRSAMARFPGYVGVSNYLGQKFTAEMDAFGPVLREIAGRGLIFLDEGSSPRSLTGTIAQSAQIPALRADVALDVDRSGGIEAGLAQLEALARKQGYAVGSATALPRTLDALQRWSAGLEGRGIALVPLTALVQRGSVAARRSDP